MKIKEAVWTLAWWLRPLAVELRCGHGCARPPRQPLSWCSLVMAAAAAALMTNSPGSCGITGLSRLGRTSTCSSEPLQHLHSDGWDPVGKESKMGSREMKRESKETVWSWQKAARLLSKHTRLVRQMSQRKFSPLKMNVTLSLYL